MGEVDVVDVEVEEGKVVGGNVVVVVVANVVVGRVVGGVGITIGTIVLVRRIFTTAFINGYLPRLQKLPEKSSRSGAQIITPPRFFPMI